MPKLKLGPTYASACSIDHHGLLSYVGPSFSSGLTTEGKSRACHAARCGWSWCDGCSCCRCERASLLLAREPNSRTSRSSSV
jgi:hypothetical protein